MRSRAGLLKGGESKEPSIVLGKPLQSPLYLAVTRKHKDDWEAMPPKENDKLSAEQLVYIKNWIAGGAPWPNTKRLAKLLKQKDPWAVEGGVLTIAWPSADGLRLQRAAAVTGPWEDVEGTAGKDSHSEAADQAAAFYRLAN